MRLFTILAGVPGQIKRMLDNADRGPLGGEDLRIYAAEGAVHYSRERLDEMLDETKQWVLQREFDEAFGVFLAYAPAPDGSEIGLRNSFFPSCSVAELQIDMTASSGNRARAAKNRFLRDAVQLRALHLARAKVMRDHLIANARTTPLLLPLEKFEATELPKLLEQLSRSGGDSERLEKSIKLVRNRLERLIPTRMYGKQRYFEAKDLIFVPPGNQSEAPAHAIARPGESHKQLCLLSGRMRLGASYNPRFHYDCQPVTSHTASAYLSCHGQGQAPAHREYVNIAPNDFVR